MEYHIKLDLEYGKEWISSKNGYASGTAFIDDKLLSKNNWKEYLDGIKNLSDAKTFVSNLNGSFAIVLKIDDLIFLAVDRQRKIPLFYSVADDKITVYNHIGLDLVRQLDINNKALGQLEYSLFVSGRDTLVNGVFQVMAGECVVIDKSGSVQKQFYYSYDYPKTNYPDKAELFELIDKKFVDVARRLIAVLNGRRAIIPLSGGHDSRLVLYYLKRLGYDNILTYTYGQKGNFESETSKKVADFLGVQWHFVEYNPKALQKLFKSDFEKLTDFYSNAVSSVCVQDWYAVDFLARNNILKADDVFIPGHSFDAIAGSFLLPKYVENETVTKEELRKDIVWKHYSEGKRALDDTAQTYVNGIIDDLLLKNEPDILPSEYAFNLYQIFNIRERQAKYICTQVRMYEFYGFDWYLPLWDNELIAFWESIDNKIKYNRKLFFEFTDYKYGDLMKAAPVQNLKPKGLRSSSMNIIWRLIRKAWQLLNYTDFHYCLSYFSRLDVYSVFFRTRILNIGYIVNCKIKKILSEGKKDD